MAAWWRGNLPCCHGPADGCEYHNPDHEFIFYNDALTPNSGGLLSWRTKTPHAPVRYTPEIHSRLAVEAAAIDGMPQIHKAVSYSLSFYHVNGALSLARASSSQAGAASSIAMSTAPLEALTCRGTHGQMPSIRWAVTPKISINNTLLLEYDLTFNILSDFTWQEGDRCPGYKKQWLMGSNCRRVALCPHMTRKFHSIRMEGKKRMRYARIEFSLSNVLGQTIKGEWRSEVNAQPPNMSCAMCYTDTSMRISVVGNVFVVKVLVHKDLGSGMDPYDPMWIAAMRGEVTKRAMNIRDVKDFGRIRAEFRGQGHQDAVEPSGVCI